MLKKKRSGRVYIKSVGFAFFDEGEAIAQSAVKGNQIAIDGELVQIVGDFGNSGIGQTTKRGYPNFYFSAVIAFCLPFTFLLKELDLFFTNFPDAPAHQDLVFGGRE